LTNNSGQICFAASRVYVQEGIYDQFLAAYQKAFEAKRKVIGDPNAAGSELGPVVDKAQYDRIMGIIETAKQEGQGTLLVGGKPLYSKVGTPTAGEHLQLYSNTWQGYYIEPAIFTDTKEDASIYKEEIFGPVVVVNKFKTEEEVLSSSNASKYGLMAGVFTQDINRALRMSSGFDSGVVGVNCISTIHFSCPFGGTKESGLGRELGVNALMAYTEPKTVLINMAY
jgi:aldehyde dehydrogenase (NAD+)/retinal dehydrogenase